MEVRKISTENKPHIVKFGGLNFDSLSQATAWISTNVASEDIGLVVDPHTVFEHMFANLSENDFLKSFERVHKLEISTLSQGYSMSSFEQPIPKLLSKAGSHVIKDDSSYLSKIVTWSDWDYPDTGLRQCLKQELEIFSRSHRLEIENTLDQESRVYALACLALSDSVSIVEALIQFIDDFVKHLTTAKFSQKKALHVTSRLAKRILTEMFEPRQGVLKSFKSKNLQQTSASIFWASIRSLDIGLGFKRTGMENLHIVSSELVKFLLVNTGYESISGLESKVATLETQVSELQRTAKNAEKTATTASNKADDLKKVCDALLKRLTKVETKVT
jgi:methyl-accepting chemotaxis protein